MNIPHKTSFRDFKDQSSDEAASDGVKPVDRSIGYNEVDECEAEEFEDEGYIDKRLCKGEE